MSAEEEAEVVRKSTGERAREKGYDDTKRWEALQAAVAEAEVAGAARRLMWRA